MKFKNYILSLLAVAGTLGLASCSDDDYTFEGNPANLVYINVSAPAGLPQNSFQFTVYHTPAGSYLIDEPEHINIYVKSTKTSTSPVTVNLALNANATVEGYSQMPTDAGMQISLDKSQVTIPAGSNVSDAITVTVNSSSVDWSKFTDEAYLVPITITSVSGAELSELYPSAYIAVTTEERGMVNDSANNEPTIGTLVTDYSDWTLNYVAADSGIDKTAGAQAFDTGANYLFFIPNHADGVNEEMVYTIDCGAVRNVTGFLVRYYYYWYTIGDATIETSTDGKNYTEQGSLSWNNNSFMRYINFYAPLSLRYVRITAHSYYSGTGEGQALKYIQAWVK
jgi:hypothetical protein